MADHVQYSAPDDLWPIY